jgi:hypothetical protein
VGATEGTPKVGYGVGICEGAERDDWLLTTEQVTILYTVCSVAGTGVVGKADGDVLESIDVSSGRLSVAYLT